MDLVRNFFDEEYSLLNYDIFSSGRSGIIFILKKYFQIVNYDSHMRIIWCQGETIFATKINILKKQIYSNNKQVGSLST